MCADYLTSKAPEYSISIEEKEIIDEKQRSCIEGLHATSKNYIETLLVYRKIAFNIINNDVLLMHGSAIMVNGKGVLFTALSGTGKSTHTRLWREMLGERCVMVNDDKPLVRVEENASLPEIYGTPWDGKHHLSNNLHCPLHAVVRLVRGVQNEIYEISDRKIFPILLQQTFRTSDSLFTTKVMNLLARLAGKVRFYELHCNMDPEAAEVAYAGIFKKTTEL